MRFVLMSDTHEQHYRVDLPDGDVLIHAGDATMMGTPSAIYNFSDWFADLPYKYKIFIAGNHDFYFEKHPEAARLSITDAGGIYLQDSGTEIEGFKIWGSPVQPWFHDWAFNRRRGNDIAAHWAKIPLDTDILVTHGPPLGVLDTSWPDGEHLGCWDLMQKVEEVKPKLHVFGHIHGGYGKRRINGTVFVNAAVLDESYQPKNDPIVVELNHEISPEMVEMLQDTYANSINS